MKIFSTRYYSGSSPYSSHIYALSMIEAEELCLKRGLEEVIETESTAANKSSPDMDKERLSDMFKNDRNPMHILHGICWLENILGNTKTLSDKGLLHEAIHYYSDKTEPTNLTKDALYVKILILESFVYGLLNKEYIMEQTKELMLNVPKDTLARLTIKTQVKMNKKDVATKTIENPNGEIFKIAQVVTKLNPSYTQAVNEQRVAEGKEANFEADTPVWGQSVGGALTEHKGEFYASYIEVEYVNTKYVDTLGNDVDKALFEAFVPKSKPAASQDLANAVKYRKVKLSNILNVEFLV